MVSSLILFLESIMSDIKLDAICTECKSKTIFFDKKHYEIYCRNCGLILVQLNNTQSNNLLDNYNFNDFKEMQDYTNINDLQ